MIKFALLILFLLVAVIGTLVWGILSFVFLWDGLRKMKHKTSNKKVLASFGMCALFGFFSYNGFNLCLKLTEYADSLIR